MDLVQMEIHRMIQLGVQEAAELQRGKNLQLLQPQHPVLQGFTQPLCGGSGGSAALLFGHTGTFSFPLVAVSSALGAAFTHAASMPDGAAQQAADATAAGQDPLPAAQQDAAAAPGAAAVQPAAADAAAQPPVSLSTPLAATPALAALQTPGSGGVTAAQAAADAGLAPPSALSPAVLGGGISSQQMALACNSMVRLPLQQVKQENPALTPLQFQLSLSGMDTATPMLQQQQQQPMHTHHTPLMQQLCSAAPAPLSLFQGGPTLMQPEPRGTAAGDAAPAASRKGKRQGYQIEHAALQRLIQRQMDGQQQQQQQAAAADSAHDLQQQQQRLLPQQQHRQRSLARIPPQLQQQHLQQKQQQAQQQQAKQQAQQQQQQPAAAQQQHAATGAGVAKAGAAAAAGGGWSSPLSAAGPGGGSQLQLPAGLDSPDACSGLQLPASLGADLLQPVTVEDLDSSKVFGSAQKRLRLSLCDEPASLVPAALQLRGLGSPPPANHPTPRAADASAAAGGPGGALATPSKFFSGSPVPLAARQQAQHTPGTPLLFGHGSGGGEAATPPWPRQPLESERSGCFPLRQQPAAEQPSGWVPITGALAGATPASAAPAGAAVAAGDGNALLVPVDTGAAAAAAAIAAAAAVSGRAKDAAAGADAGATAGLATPQVAEQQAPATTRPL